MVSSLIMGPNSNGYPKSEISTGVRSNEQSLEFSSLGFPLLPSLGLDNSNTNASFFIGWTKREILRRLPMIVTFPTPFSSTYISQVLLEEDMEEKPCMFHDSLELQAAEKSLYGRFVLQGPSTQLPLDPEFMKKVGEKVKDCYHSDFIVDVDGWWMLHGWKGRIVYASSAWVPASSPVQAKT